jgi:putative methionine-R-sulfoxide reductase with GAF domain
VYPKGHEGDLVKAASEQDFVNHISTLQNGDHLVTARDAAYLLNGKTYTLHKLKVPDAGAPLGSSFQSSNGIVWITTTKGLYCFDSSMRFLKNISHLVKNKFVTAGFALENGLLLATEDGLFELDYNRGTPYIRKRTTFFNNRYISSLFQDRKGVIWASTEAGIYRYDTARGKTDLLDHSDNVQGYGFNPNAWFRNKSGMLFWGGSNGINYLQPETFTITDDSLFVYFGEIKINNSDTAIYTLPRDPLLPYSQHSIEIECASVYFHNPAKVAYRYWLQGYDDDWKLLGSNNTIRFTSLQPGHYNLLMQASLNGMDWVTANQNFRFRIDAPFWRRWWFVALCSFGIIGVVLLVIRNRNKKIKEQQEELEAEQAINHFAATMQEDTDVDTILWDVARNCISRLHFEDCVIYLLDEERKVLVQKAAYGPKSPREFSIAEPIEIPVGRGITGTVAQTGRAEIISDTSKDGRYIVDDQQRYSEITIPIISNGQVLGVIDCEHTRKNFFTSRHLSLLTTIASLCANKIIRSLAEAEKANVQLNLLKAQQRMAEVEMQALRAQMNPHFIFNCLNSINRYIVKSDQQTASLYLTKFAKLIRLILDNSNSKNVLLSSELEALKLYIDMEALRFDKKFSYQVEVDEGIGPDSIEVPPLIIQPYVENAIWHGLLHKQTVGHLHIHFSMSGSSLQCVIKDNGVGREKANELRSKSVTTKKSLGMKLTEDRLALLNKHAQRNASINIIDLKDERGEALGTQVILLIPI